MGKRVDKELNRCNKMKVTREFCLEDMAPIQRALLLLVGSSPNGIIDTDLRMQKLAFLYSKSIGDSALDEEFDFTPYDFGPYSENLAAAVELMGAQGFLKKDQSRNRYRTSRKGDEAVAAIAGLYPDFAEAAREIVGSIGQADPMDIVAVVYELYPEYTENSLIASRMKARHRVDSLVIPIKHRELVHEIALESRRGKQVTVRSLEGEVLIEELEEH